MCVPLLAPVDTSSAFEVLHSFTSGANGGLPLGALMQAANGTLYGTTSFGGDYGAGTVFTLDAAGTLSTLHTFSIADGTYPSGNLTDSGDGFIYGTTRYGGAGYGTIFRMDRDGFLETVHNFTDVDGYSPNGALVRGSDGDWYATTYYGGSSGAGTIFKLDAANVLTTLHHFTYSEGAYPETGLILGGDGNVYGSTMFGRRRRLRHDLQDRQRGHVHHAARLHLRGRRLSGRSHSRQRRHGRWSQSDWWLRVRRAVRIDLASGAVTRIHAFTADTDGAYPSHYHGLGPDLPTAVSSERPRVPAQAGAVRSSG